MSGEAIRGAVGRGERYTADTRRRAFEDRPWPWLTPLICLLAVFYLYPLIEVLRLSFTDAIIGSADYRYTLASYASAIGARDFARMAHVTFVFVGASVFGQLGLGLAIAVLVHEGERRGLRGAALVRATVLVGWVLPGVVIGIVWRLLLDESGAGILSYAATFVGISDAVFLTAADPALFWVIVANVWRGTAFSMLMEYAGLKTVPEELYEAATVDGANGWQKFVNITLPSLRRVILINLILITIATLNTFDMVMPLTGGGPGRATEVVALHIYSLVFREFSLGRGAAVAVMLMLVGLTLTIAYSRLLARDDEERTV